MARGNLACDADKRNGIKAGVGNGGEYIGCSRARGGKTDLGLPGHPCHPLGDEAGPLLMAGENMTKAAVAGQGVVKREVGAAWNSGESADTLALQEVNNEVGAAHFHDGTLLSIFPPISLKQQRGL